jgi:hypothetical protein
MSADANAIKIQGADTAGNAVTVSFASGWLDVSGTELRVSLYGKNAAAGDTPVKVLSDGTVKVALTDYGGSNINTVSRARRRSATAAISGCALPLPS